MKILFIFSINRGIMPFVQEQKLFLERQGIKVDCFYITKNGFVGYFRELSRLTNVINNGGYQLTHAHFGLAGLLAVIHKQVPVIITFHGSDIYSRKTWIFCVVASYLCDFSIFVNRKMSRRTLPKKQKAIIPCGVDETIFYYIPLDAARKKLSLAADRKYILFASAFDIPVKNYKLAKEALSLIDLDIELIELKGFSREQVNLLLNASDLLLLTSHSEGSPQIVKEALFCRTPIISTRVGDVPELLDNVDGCYLTDFDPQDIAKKINQVLAKPRKTIEFKPKKNYSANFISKRLAKIYYQVIAQVASKKN